jgi:hypothetical protein
MGVTNKESGTNVNEIAAGIYRISTPVGPEVIPGGFTINQYLIVDDQSLIFHTGLRKMFPLVREAVASVIPVERLRYIAFLTRRGRRMRLAQSVAGCGARCGAAMRTDCSLGFDRGSG